MIPTESHFLGCAVLITGKWLPLWSQNGSLSFVCVVTDLYWHMMQKVVAHARHKMQKVVAYTSLSADPWKMAYRYQKGGLRRKPQEENLRRFWHQMGFPLTSHRFQNLLGGHRSGTAQLSAKHIWTLQGYVHLMRGMPLTPPFDTDRWFSS